MTHLKPICIWRYSIHTLILIGDFGALEAPPKEMKLRKKISGARW